ncbi:MAG: hypothetical protein M1820_000729 [Bogoriella megaspora]|nr:MAG: hypothetical protein M1820_000729 [Bogoriella megaspora]
MAGLPETQRDRREYFDAGAVAAFSVDLLVYPLDTLKTRLQSPDYKRLYTHAATETVNRGALFRGLYQGVGSVIIATLPSSGAFFTTYEASKSFLNNSLPSTPLIPQPLIHASASSIAELVSCAILTPAEVIKQNAQMVNTETSSRGIRQSATLQTLKKFRSSPLNLWRGYTALAGRNLPFTALQFPLFEHLKLLFTKRRHRQRRLQERSGKEAKLSILEQGLITATSAGLAGSLAAWITTPVDVVKTRVMLAAGEEGARRAEEAAREAERREESGKALKERAKESVKAGKDGLKDALGSNGENVFKKKSSLQIAREVVQESGVRGLFRGGALRAVWTMLGSGLYLGVYESGRTWLARRRGDVEDED